MKNSRRINTEQNTIHGVSETQRGRRDRRSSSTRRRKMKQAISRLGVGAITLLLICSCKDDEKANTKPATVNEQLAVQSAENTIATMAGAILGILDRAEATQEKILSLALEDRIA